MPPPLLVPLAGAVILGVLVAVLTGPVLRRLPGRTPEGSRLHDGDPLPGPAAPPGLFGEAIPDDAPPHYPALATRGFALACGGLGAAASLTALALAPAPWLPLWLVWSTAFALLVSIDARTTWLPLRLTHMVWGLGSVAVILALLPLSGRAAAPADLVRVLLGGLASGLFYLVLWRLGHGLGFGDVRISPLIGALGASVSWTGWWVALVAGSLLGALWGIARILTGRRGPFAYGPWMWLGPAASLLFDAAGPGLL
ncbi:prepilin peptidase [Raineyella sp.]|uniref:prepilin peptidase n=1 Tax=Raineyella sp. TaxID=1911550 RepID=UPI002B1FE0F5|nr:prepilin peptidase [Raineyella sp.]MEA5155204.1 prepilin peptidase [Raineyella sp.]